MNVLLDTHILIWIMNDPSRLSQKAQHYIRHADSLYVSAASIWEICIKMQINKIQLDLPVFMNEIEVIGLRSLAITQAHARYIPQLPLYHEDPFDRMLIAQAMSEPLTLLTHDVALAPYSPLVQTLDTL